MVPADVGHLAALLMLAQYTDDLSLCVFARSYWSKVQVLVWVLLSHAPEIGGAYKVTSPYGFMGCII